MIRRYSVLVIIHIIVICALAVLTYISVSEQMWFSAMFSLMAVIFFSVHLYRLQMVQLRIMRQLAKSLREGDMMISFRAPYRNSEMEEMIKEISLALEGFRTRVIERNEIEAWQRLIRVLNHEIMNSITPILSLSETFSQRDAGDGNYADIQQAMQTIHRRSKGLLEFVENYRKLTRIPAPVCKPASIKDLFTHLQNLFPEQYIHITLPGNDCVVTMDRSQIEQVLINLIKNAMEACTKAREDSEQNNVDTKKISEEIDTPDLSKIREPEIKVDARISKSENGLKDKCIITVRDNGCGILPDALDEVFIPFYTTKPQGSGIGLSVCRQIIHNHGGTILASSTPNQGSTFSITF